MADFTGEEAYRFRHVLIRDAAYRSLTKSARADLHERYAVWLERAAEDRLREFEEIVGYHLEQAFRYRVALGARPHADSLPPALRAARGGRAAGTRPQRPAGGDRPARAGSRLLVTDDPRRTALLARSAPR